MEVHPNLSEFVKNFSDSKDHECFFLLEVLKKKSFMQGEMLAFDSYVLVNCFVTLYIGHLLGETSNSFKKLLAKI